MKADLSIDELADLLGLHPETLRQHARMGRLPGVYRVGRRWRMSRAAADLLRRVPAETATAGKGTHDE